MTLARRTLLALPPALMANEAAAQLQAPPAQTPPLAPSQNPSSVWYAVRGPDHSFVVDMPGEPVYKVIDTTAPGGGRFAYHSYSLEYRRLSFVVQTVVYPADVDVRQPRMILQAVLDERAQRLAGGKWTKIDWRDVQGASAAESLGPVSGGNVLRQLVVLRGRRLVSLACLGPAEALRSPEVERFFLSLRFST